MAVPKRKVSKSKTRSRIHSRAHKRLVLVASPCGQCGSPHRPHRVCPTCGYYRGRQVITVEAV